MPILYIFSHAKAVAYAAIVVLRLQYEVPSALANMDLPNVVGYFAETTGWGWGMNS